jgi:hypothetical protein
MDAIVSGQISFRASDCHPRVIEQLWQNLTFANPEYVSRQRMGWATHGIPETIECIAQDAAGLVRIPRGAVGLLRERLRGIGQEVHFEDRRVCFSEPGMQLPPLGPVQQSHLRSYQREAVAAMQRRVQGTILSPCGSGKTQMGVAAIGAIRQPALILVHTHDLAEQWRERIAMVLGQTTGIIAGGESRLEPITVATVQTLSRMEPAALEQLGQRFGCVVLDECLPGDARVITREHGVLPIRELVQHGSQVHVLSFNHDHGLAEFQRVVRATSKRVHRRMVTIRIRRDRNIRVLRVTEEHPVFVEGRGYIPAIEVRPGDRVIMLRGFYPCPKCERVFVSRSGLGGHLASSHRENAGLQRLSATGGLCPHCWKPCATVGALRIHIRRHEDPEWDRANREAHSRRMRATNLRRSDVIRQRMLESNPSRLDIVRHKNRKLHRARGEGAYDHLQGGNGRPPTVPETLLHERLGNNWVWQHVMPTRIPRGEGYPAHYKIDLAEPALRIAIEVDGESHRGEAARQRDEKKDAFLRSLGWRVLRMKNKAVIQDPDGCAAMIQEACRARDAELQSR